MEEQQRERVVACLSGGVDSSVAAARLVEQGYDVVGVFMRSGVAGAQTTGEKQGCCSVEDALDARRVADLLGIPFYALNMREQFDRLIDRFAADYARGRTPNPCVLCNRWFKFGHVLELAAEVGARKVSSGHYARILPSPAGRLALARPRDRRKDQSYVLAVLEQEQLARVLLPLGESTKDEVRAEAEARGLTRVAGKADSQEICFVAGDYLDLLQERLPAETPALQPGPIVDEEGRELGRHQGTASYTVGQRRGLGVAAPRPLYVIRTEPQTATVVAGPHEALRRRGLLAEETTWIGAAPLAPGASLRGRAQLRAHGSTTLGMVTALPEGQFRFQADEGLPSVVPGQAAVIYDEDDEQVLLSGWITQAT